jgi:serine/threonine-protein kinase RsbW
MKTSLCNRIENCGRDIVADEAGARIWRRDAVHSVFDIVRVLETIAGAMTDAGFSDKEVYRVRLSLEEAIVNAHKHGHDGDWDRPVGVRYHVSQEGVVAQVEDQGDGFDPQQVPDPRDPENLERPSGRGLLIMRTYLPGVCHNERGNRVCLCTHRRDDRP